MKKIIVRSLVFLAVCIGYIPALIFGLMEAAIYGNFWKELREVPADTADLFRSLFQWAFSK